MDGIRNDAGCRKQDFCFLVGGSLVDLKWAAKIRQVFGSASGFIQIFSDFSSHCVYRCNRLITTCMAVSRRSTEANGSNGSNPFTVANCKAIQSHRRTVFVAPSVAVEFAGRWMPKLPDSLSSVRLYSR